MAALFYESTGLYGKSSLRRVEPMSGQVLAHRRLVDPNLFSEGLALVGDRSAAADLEGRHRAGLRPRPASSWSTNTVSTARAGGWPTTVRRLVMSDGTHRRLTFRDTSKTSAGCRPWRSPWRGRPVRDLNELEFAEGLALCQRLGSGAASCASTPTAASVDGGRRRLGSAVSAEEKSPGRRAQRHRLRPGV